MIRLFNTHNIRPQVELDGLWDFNDGYRMPVPGCWEMHPDFLTYRGQGVYKRSITTDKTTNLRLEFKGVSHTADVYFDGELVAHHYNAYTTFSAIIPGVEAGSHDVMVKVDNSFSEASSLHIGNDYYTYGGIIRPVVLEQIADCFIERIEFAPPMVKVIARNISDADKKVTLKATLGHMKLDFGEINIEKNSSAEICKEFTFEGFEEWSHENPVLYLLETVLYENEKPIDDLIERVGFRTVSISGQKMLVNNKPILMMGFNRHEDHANAGCSLPFTLMVKDIELIKSSGANAVRTCHYPNDELFLDLCDENGLYVWEENHARGLSLEKMKNPNFEYQCQQCNYEMVTNHFNHPSIVVWGLLNECASHEPEGREMYIKQFEQIRSLDGTRPLSSASNRPFNDLCFDLADIISVNLYAGWYHDDDVAEFYAKFSEGKDKPIILSEFGAASVYGFREPTRVKWSEERQSDILDECLSVYLNREEIAGAFIWQFADCRVTEEENWFLSRARTKNNKGIFDEYRRPKLSFEIVKKHFMGKRA